jgi:hypothetical protein
MKQIKWLGLSLAWFIISTLLQSSAQSQQPAAKAGVPLTDTGSISGRVFIEGTKQPLGFAGIRLVPEPASTPADQQAERTGPYLTMVDGLAQLNGAFRMEGVPPGDYFAGAVMLGFVAPCLAAGENATDSQLKLLIPSMPTVHVVAGQVAHIDLSLRRGATITGKVQYADGRPAVGLSVQWEIAEQNLADKSVRLARPSALQEVVQRFDPYTTHRREVVTDDEGQYRIYGLPPGNYILSTSLPERVDATSQILMSDGTSPTPDRLGFAMSSLPAMTLIYGAGVFRRNEAKVYRIRGSEEVADANLKIDLSGLFSVKGRLTAGEDRHVPSQAALRLQENGGQDVGKIGGIGESGFFEFDHLPPGNYTLQLMGAQDEVPGTGPSGTPPSIRRYKLAKIPVVVKDLNVELGDIVLTALKPGETEEYPE